MVRAVAALLLALTAGTVAEAGEESTTARMENLWTRYSTGYVPDIAVGDMDGDGQNEAVVAGRGLGVMAPDSLASGRFRWVNKWLDAAGQPVAGDHATVTEFVLHDLTGDGAADAIVGSDTGLFAIDGKTGETLWVYIDESSGTAYGAHELVIGDFNQDGTPDVASAELLDERVTAVDGKTGALLWIYPRPRGYVFDLAAGDLNGDGFTDVVVVGQVDAGFEVHAISGLGAAQTGVATPLWVQNSPALPSLDGGTPGSIAIAQVQPGLSPEVVIGGNGALMVLDGLTGAPLAQRTFQQKAVANVIPVQLDQDDALEIVAIAVSFATVPASHSVEAFDSDTTPLWTVSAPAPVGEIVLADLDLDGRSEIVAGGGFTNLGGVEEQDGFVLAIKANGATPTTEWLTRLPADVDSIAVGKVFGQDTVLAGQRGAFGLGGGVYGLDFSGQERWFFRAGGRVEAVLVSDLDGDSTPEVIKGSEDSYVVIHDDKGDLRWQARVPGKGGPSVQALAANDLTAAPGKEIAVGTYEFDPNGAPGRVHLFSAAGERLWNRGIAGAVDAIAIEDVDADGTREVIVAASSKSFETPEGRAIRYDAAGNVIWQTAVPTGQRTTLSLVDINGDGVKDLLLTRNSVFHGGAVFVVDGNSGGRLWTVDLPDSVNWASVGEAGITAGDLAGNVRLLRTVDGSEVWRVDYGSASWGGEWTIDSNGDNVRDVLSASEEGKVRMLAGTDGSILWEADTEGNPAFKVVTLLGGPRPFVGVGERGQGTYSPATLIVLDAMNGDRIGASATHGPVLALAKGNLDNDPEDEFVAAAGWQLEAMDVRLLGLRLVSVVSRKVHGSAGAFDIELPLSGSLESSAASATVTCRANTLSSSPLPIP